MDNKGWVGIDAGKGFHWAVMLGAEGEVLLSRRVNNDEADLSVLIEESVDDMSIQTKGYQFYGGRWNQVADSGRKTLGTRGNYFRVKAQVRCSTPYTQYSFRTNNITPQIKVNGVWKTLLSKETKALKNC